MTTTELPGAKRGTPTHDPFAPGSNFTDGHPFHGTQPRPAVGEPHSPADHLVADIQLARVGGGSSLPATIDVSNSIPEPSRATQPPRANDASLPMEGMPGDPTSDAAIVVADNHRRCAASEPTSPLATEIPPTQRLSAGGDPYFTDDQDVPGTQVPDVVSEPNPDSGQESSGTQTALVAVGPTSTSPDQSLGDIQERPVRAGGFLRDPVLGVLSDVLDDFETVRIANANRVRILTRSEEDSDGESRGWGLTEDHPEVAKLLLTLKALESAEHDSVLNLQRALRKHPLVVVQKRYRGLGEKQFARMLATIGDPYWNDLHQRPRTVSELWAYCGLDVRNGEAPRRQRGQQSNWSEDARKRLYVISSSLVKGGRMADDKRGPQDPVADKYRVLYDATKAKYADSVHPVDCKRCGPAGKPALAGSPRSAAHIHAIAIRAMSKELLKELWREARDIYEKEN